MYLYQDLNRRPSTIDGYRTAIVDTLGPAGHHIAQSPGWPGMPWFWDPVQLSTEIPLQLPVSTTLLKQSHNYVFHSNPQHLNLHAWCLGVDNSKNKASMWRWLRELLPLRGHQQGPSTSQSGPYLQNGAEKIRWISPLHLRNKSQTFSCTFIKI